jgi:hypothetical protein
MPSFKSGEMEQRVSQAWPVEMPSVVKKLHFRALQHLTMRKPIRNMLR